MILQYIYAMFPRQKCALKFGDETSATLEMLHLSLTNLLVYWNHRRGEHFYARLSQWAVCAVGAWCCQSCTIQPFRSCNNILLQALESEELPAVFKLCCSSLRKQRAVYVMFTGQIPWLEPSTSKAAVTDFHRPRHAKGKYKYHTESGFLKCH